MNEQTIRINEDGTLTVGLSNGDKYTLREPLAKDMDGLGQDLIKKDIMSQFSNLDDLIENMTKLGYLSEGAIACKYVHEIAQRKNLKLTICDGLYRILNKEICPRDFIAQLLTQEK